MDWCFGQYGNGETCHSDRVKNDGRVVEISEERNAEAVDDRMRYEKSGVDANRFACGWRVTGAYSCSCGDESCAAERDARRYRDLTEQVEPTGDPRVKSRLVIWGQDGSPEVGTSAGRDGRDDFSHAEGNEEGEEADDDPTDRHDAWSTCR